MTCTLPESWLQFEVNQSQKFLEQSHSKEKHKTQNNRQVFRKNSKKGFLTHKTWES